MKTCRTLNSNNRFLLQFSYSMLVVLVTQRNKTLLCIRSIVSRVSFIIICNKSCMDDISKQNRRLTCTFQSMHPTIPCLSSVFLRELFPIWGEIQYIQTLMNYNFILLYTYLFFFNKIKTHGKQCITTNTKQWFESKREILATIYL